jgi:Fe-S cluster assembly protein SufD
MTAVVEAPPTDLAPRTLSNDPAAFPPPTGREEEWRFTPLDEVRDFFDVHARPTLGFRSSSPLVTIGAIDDGTSAIDLPSAVARSLAAHAIVVDIPDDHVSAEAIDVALVGAGAMNVGHIIIRCGRHATATVVIRHDLGSDSAGTIVSHLGDGASLTVLSLMDGSGESRHMWQWHSVIGRDSRLNALSVTMGGAFIRMCPSVEFSGPGGSVDIVGAFLTQGAEYQEHRVFVDHNQPHCSSNVVYKGALSGDSSHSVWVGDVLVRRNAIGIDTYELNRNLLLNDGPRADSVPNLELETGDVVGAGHASATGRFDDEQLFYLQSRGIPESLARQLVVRGFFVDVLTKITDESLRKEVLGGLEARIGMSELLP